MATTDRHRIVIKDKYAGLLRSRGVNYSAFLQPEFNFRPTSFTTSIEGLVPKVFSRKKQTDFFDAFLDDPLRPRTFAITSAPNDSKAKLLAAFMMQWVMMKHGARARLPFWHDMTGGFHNPLLKEHVECSMLVLSNVGNKSTQLKMEKTRDLLEAYADLPKIVVVNGMDPFAFMTEMMYLPMHGCAYLTNNMVSRAITV